MEKNPTFMTRDENSLRIVKRKDGTILMTAIRAYDSAVKNMKYPKGFDVDRFIQLMKNNGYVIDGEKKESPRF